MPVAGTYAEVGCTRKIERCGVYKKALVVGTGGRRVLRKCVRRRRCFQMQRISEDVLETSAKKKKLPSSSPQI